MSRGPYIINDSPTLHVAFKTTGKGWSVKLDEVDLSDNVVELTVIGKVDEITLVKIAMIGLPLEVSGEVEMLPGILKLARDLGETCEADGEKSAG